MVESNPDTELLPDPGPQSSDDHARISRRFMQHAWEQLEQGNRLQTSEKAWGATCHALKAIAVQRGWRHDDRSLEFAIAGQLASEFDRADFDVSLNTANGLHSNFYANQQDEEAIRNVLLVVERFVDDLEEVRQSSPRPFTVTTNPEQNRLQNLLGRRVPLNSHSEVGFAQEPRHRRERPGRNGDDDGRESSPVVGPKPDDHPPAGGQAQSIRRSDTGTTSVALKLGKQIGPDKADSTPMREIRRRSRQSKGKGEKSAKVNIQLG